MCYFIEVEHLYDLEKQEKWEDVRKLLYSMWAHDSLNIGKHIRLFAECWLILAEWDCLAGTQPLSFQVFQDTLIECTEFGIKNFMNIPQFLCVSGYMMSLFPYLFYTGDNDLYSLWEQKGVEMLHKAHALDPSSKVAEILSLGCSQTNIERYNALKSQLQPEISTLFPRVTMVELYFKDVLSLAS